MIWDNPFYILVFVLGITALIGPIWTLVKEPKNVGYWFLGLLGLFAGPLWALSTTSFLATSDIQSGRFWAQMIYLVSIFIGFFHYFFSINYLKKKKISVLMTLFVLLGFGFLFYQVLFTENFIKEINLGEKNLVILGDIYILWVIWLVVTFSVDVFNTLKSYKTLSSIEKERQKYLIIGNIITVVGSFPANIIAPYFGIYEYIWFGPVVFPLANLIISYGLTQIRFQRFQKIIRNFTRSFSLYFLMPLVLIFIITQALKALPEWGINTYIIYGIVLLGVGIYLKLFEITSSIVFPTEKQILRTKGDSFKDLVNFEQELPQICMKTLKYLCENTPANRAQVYIYDSVNAKSYHYTEGVWTIPNLRRIFLELPRYWKDRDLYYKPLIRSELEFLRSQEPINLKEISSLIDFLRIASIELVYPIISGNELVGVLMIRDIEEEQIYKIDEMDLIKNIYGHFHISVNKALLYQQLQTFNQTLQQKVNEQTKELQVKIQELQEARRKERDMVDIMGHELRTPATIAKLNIELLERYIDTNPAEFKKYLDRVKGAIENEIKLINTLLSSAKLEGDKIELQLEEVDIKKEIAISLSGYEHQALEKNLQLINQTDPNLSTVYGDHARVTEIINNLVSNAVKYTEKGSITVRAQNIDNFVQISVIDTGKGIPKEDIPNIGQKFYRVQTYINSDHSDNVNIVRPGGTGLGLYVAFSLVRKMGGNIHVESEVDKGSIFTFTLPKYKGQQITTKDSQSSKDMFEKLGLKKKTNEVQE